MKGKKQNGDKPADYYAKQLDKTEGIRTGFQNNILLNDTYSSGIYFKVKHPQESRMFGMIPKSK